MVESGGKKYYETLLFKNYKYINHMRDRSMQEGKSENQVGKGKKWVLNLSQHKKPENNLSSHESQKIFCDDDIFVNSNIADSSSLDKVFNDFHTKDNEKKVECDEDIINTSIDSFDGEYRKHNEIRHNAQEIINRQQNKPEDHVTIHDTNFVRNKRVVLYKTEMCRSFSESGYCKYGHRCQFGHDTNEIRLIQRHPKYKTEICRTFWNEGSCPYGARCCFVHLEDLSHKKEDMEPESTFEDLLDTIKLNINNKETLDLDLTNGIKFKTEIQEGLESSIERDDFIIEKTSSRATPKIPKLIGDEIYTGDKFIGRKNPLMRDVLKVHLKLKQDLDDIKNWEIYLRKKQEEIMKELPFKINEEEYELPKMFGGLSFASVKEAREEFENLHEKRMKNFRGVFFDS